MSCVAAVLLIFFCITSTPLWSRQTRAANNVTVVSERCIQALVSLAKSAGTPLSLAGDRVSISGRELRLRAQIEEEDHAESRWLLGLRVDVLLDGVLQPLTHGAVGIGKDRDDALETAVHEWTQLVGVALLRALGVKVESAPPLSSGSFSVYPGATGFRGSQGVPWSDENQKELLRRLEPIVVGLQSSPGELHSISLLVVVPHSRGIPGECRVDGTISQAALKAVLTFQWPSVEGEYIFKQFYVLRRR